MSLGTVGGMGGYQNHGPLLGPLNTRCRIIFRTPKKDHNFDNHPCRSSYGTGICRSETASPEKQGAPIKPTLRFRVDITRLSLYLYPKISLPTLLQGPINGL